MSIPPQFTYANEDAFTKDFLIPLLQRLGFSLVVNYHGHAEFGKDLIFAEIDRFGHVRYHGLQSKYVPSISLNEVQDLIRDCEQAFATPFVHPQTGTTERISSFYAVNGGSLGSEASQHFFNSLVPRFGGNIRLLQAKDLLVLDRWVASSRMENVTAVINGILAEIQHNENTVMPLIIKTYTPEHAQNGNKVNVAVARIRTTALSAYSTQPTLQGFLSVGLVLNYCLMADQCNNILVTYAQPFVANESRRLMIEQILSWIGELTKDAVLIRAALVEARKTVAPLTPL